MECGYNVHEKCQSQVPWQCRKPRDLREQGVTSLAKSTTSLPEVEKHSCVIKLTLSSLGYFELSQHEDMGKGGGGVENVPPPPP